MNHMFIFHIKLYLLNSIEHPYINEWNSVSTNINIESVKTSRSIWKGGDENHEIGDE